MGERVKCNALVLVSHGYGETSKMLTAFTDKFGKISISAKGAAKPTGPFIACSQEFCYSSMELSEGRNGIYTLCECELINSFYALRENIDVLYTAYEIGKAVMTVAQEDFPDEDLLRLTLNTLFYLCKISSEAKNSEEASVTVPERIDFVKSVFYIRLASDQGFFDQPEKYRENACGLAVAHITECDFKELFAFSLSQAAAEELQEIAERAKTAVLD